MRLRITLAFVAVLALAIGIAGGATFILVRHAQARAAQQNIERVSQILVTAVKGKSGQDIAKQDVLDVIEQVGGLNHVTLISVDSSGHITGKQPTPGLPFSVIERDGNGKRLAENKVISGTYNGIAFSAAPLLQTPGVPTIALVFEATEDFSSDLYFLVAGLVALGGAALLAALISRQIATRIVRVARAAEQIASGDFDVRLARGRRDYPEIAQLDRAINSMAEDLSHAQEQEREFLLSISHDLRTPLTSIRGYAEAIADGAVPDPHHAAGVVVSEATRLERLIGDLLDLARLRAHQFTLDFTTVDLGAAAASAADALGVAFESVDVTLAVTVPDPAADVRADRHRVAQIAANLLENALKYAAHDVTVSVSVDKSSAALAVEDDGPGIDPDDLPHVLERLFTSDRHPARASGTGLGLAIVAELAEAMDGAVAIESPTRPIGGTRITVTFPLADTGPTTVGDRAQA